MRPGARTRGKQEHPWRLVSRFLGLSFLLPLCVAIGYGIGFLLDRAFHTTFLRIVFLLIGVAAGIRELLREAELGARMSGLEDPKTPHDPGHDIR